MLRLPLDGPACRGEVWAASPMGSKGKGAKTGRMWADVLQWWGECPASSLQFPELGQVQVLRERTSALAVLFPASSEEPLVLIVVTA